jgi:hypothetical protein
MKTFMKLVLCMVAVTTFVSMPARAQNCPAGCQTQLDELKKRTPIFQGWRPTSGTDLSKTFTLPLTPDLAVVTLFQWDAHRPGIPIYTVKPTRSIIVTQGSTTVFEVPKQPDDVVNHTKFFVDAPCKFTVTLSEKSLSYTNECGAQNASPAFNVIFMFTESSKP